MIAAIFRWVYYFIITHTHTPKKKCFGHRRESKIDRILLPSLSPFLKKKKKRNRKPGPEANGDEHDFAAASMMKATRWMEVECSVEGQAGRQAGRCCPMHETVNPTQRPQGYPPIHTIQLFHAGSTCQSVCFFFFAKPEIESVC
jgi:hypothetical protein